MAEDYVRLATTNQNDSATESINNPEASDNFLGYGFQIWMCKPKGVYRADGAMGQFTIVCPDQDMLIAINETAIGAHWAQSTLDITWEFLKQIQDETLCEDSEAARLSERLRRLNLPNPVVRQQSSLAAQLNGRVFTVESGVLSAEIYNFMSGKDICPVETFSFLFNSYGCEWITQSAEESRKIFVSTVGSRFANIVGGQQDQTRLLVCDGAWTEECVFEMNLRWVETCFTKRLTFRFADGKVYIEDVDNNAFRSDGPRCIVAR